MTSSIATILGTAFKSKDGETLDTENDFAPIDGVDSYVLSKIRQEEIIRDYLKF